MMASSNRLKIIFVGNSGVGKTSIYKLFEEHTVEKSPRATVGLSVTVVSLVIPELSHRTIEAEVWDTAGTERHFSTMRQYYRQADIVILVYDITDAKSFRAIDDYWLREVRENNGNDLAKLMLLGNKVDQDKGRKVKDMQAQGYASKNDMFFFEMSAINAEHYNVLYDAMMTAVKHVMTNGGPCKYRVSQDCNTPQENVQEPDVVFVVQEPAATPQIQNRCKCSLL